MYAFTLCVIKPWLGLNTFWGLLHIILFNSFSLIAIYSHIMAMTTDPGAVPKNAYPLQDDTQEMNILDNGVNNGNNNNNNNINNNNVNNGSNNNTIPKFKKFCKKCEAFKPARAHHCSICMRCIVKMDHHCPWVNNCVGIGNHKFFILFIFWTNVVCSYSLVMVLSMYSACIFRYGKCVTDANENVLGVLLLVESILFGLFTLCMIADQGSSISSNQTQIDRLKNMRHESPAHLLEINEVFGTPNNISFEWKWLLPIIVKYPDNLKDKIMGIIVIVVFIFMILLLLLLLLLLYL